MPEQRSFWSKGRHPEYDAFVIEVHVRKDRTGALSSFRRLPDQIDEEVAQSLGSSGGMEEGALALLTEGIKTEVMLQTLIKVQNLPNYRDMILQEGMLPEIFQKSTSETMQHLQRVLEHIVPGLVEDTVRTIASELGKE